MMNPHPMRPLLVASLSLTALACNDPAPATQSAPATPAVVAPVDPHGGAPADPHGGAPADPHGGAPTAAGAVPQGPASAGGLTWKAPAPLSRRAPKSRMRAAEYVVEDPGAPAPAVLTVFYFGTGQGGTVQANLDRWIGQMTQPDGKPSSEAAKVETLRVGTVEVTLLDVTGTYGGGMGGGGPATDQRMLAAAALGPKGPVFFKLVGAAGTVARAHDAFRGMLDSITPAG